MNEVETLRAAAQILKRETGYVVDSVVMRDLADRLDRPDPDEALAEELRIAVAMAIHLAFGGGGLWQSLSAQSRADWVEVARAARAHIEAESAEDAPAPASEPWRPTPGQWAQIKPGADREDVPESVERVLVLEMVGHTEREAKVGWVGDAMPDGTTWDHLPTASLAPVQPRVWECAEDVPVHVVVRDRDGDIAHRLPSTGTMSPDEIRADFYGPFTEVIA